MEVKTDRGVDRCGAVKTGDAIASVKVEPQIVAGATMSRSRLSLKLVGLRRSRSTTRLRWIGKRSADGRPRSEKRQRVQAERMVVGLDTPEGGIPPLPSYWIEIDAVCQPGHILQGGGPGVRPLILLAAGDGEGRRTWYAGGGALAPPPQVIVWELMLFTNQTTYCREEGRGSGRPERGIDWAVGC
jgi:hypothetical protein